MIKVTVVHIVISLDTGGLERLVSDMVKARNRSDSGATNVCCLDRPGALAGQAEGATVLCLNAERSRFPWDGDAVKHLRTVIIRELEEAKGVILHAHNTAAWQYAVLAARGTEARVVVTHHGSNLYTRGMMNGLRNRWLASQTAAIVAVSASVKSELCATWGFKEAEISVIRNGVRMDAETGGQRLEVRRNVRLGLGISEEAKVVGYVGRLSLEKGVDRLISAFAEMLQTSDFRLQISGLRLLIVGDGEERESLNRQAAGLGLEECVVFTGFKNDARELMKAMDLFVLPSRSEGLPVALLEAMSAGVPVAATDVGETRAVLKDGEFGGILSDDDTKWAPSIDALISSPANSKRLAEAQAHVAENYSFDAMMDSYESLYRSLNPDV